MLQDILDRPVRQEVLRLDYHISYKWRMFFRGQNMKDDQKGRASTANKLTWLDVPVEYVTHAPNVGFHFTTVVSQTAVNELSVGMGRWTEDQGFLKASDLARLQRDKLGIAIGQLYPMNNPLNLVPAASFGRDITPDTSNATFAYDGRFPMGNGVISITISEAFTRIWRAHTFKAGINLEGAEYNQPHSSGSFSFTGSFNFGRTSVNPLDANLGYANALLGNFQSYTEATGRPDYAPRTRIAEWFVQDNWKAGRRLTLDYGLRFTYALPQVFKRNQGAALALDRYDRSKAPVLYRPVFDATRTRVAQNPLTGELLPPVFIGTFVPGSGVLGDLVWNPPVIFSPVQYYGNVDTFTNIGGVLAPSSLRTIERYAHVPAIYSMSFGVQRQIGFGTMLDAAYIGTLGRHLGQTRDINMIPYGARWLPENQDPTRPGNALPDVFFRPYPGYTGIDYREFASTSNYHSLQVQARRNFRRGLQFGAAWTWSKNMSYTDGSASAGDVPTYAPLRQWSYGKSDYDRTHYLTLNWLWDVPRGSKLLGRNPAVKAVFDGWQMAGMTRFISGQPRGISGSLNDGTDQTGGGDGWRPIMLANPVLPRSQRTFYRFFNTGVFARPARGSIGNAPKDVFRGPGINNWNLSFFKNFPVYERRLPVSGGGNCLRGGHFCSIRTPHSTCACRPQPRPAEPSMAYFQSIRARMGEKPMQLTEQEQTLLQDLRRLPADTAREIGDLTHRLAKISQDAGIEWSDSWSEADLRECTKAALDRMPSE